MSPVRGLNTGANFIELRRWSFLTCVLSLGSFICCFSPVETFDTNATACSDPRIEDNCNFFKLQCPDGEKIQILNAQSVLKDNNPNNPGIRRNQCNPPQTCDAKCCRPRKAVYENYSSLHLYSLLNECSWRNNCTAKAQYLSASSVLCEVSYRCVPGKTHAVKFCQASRAPVTAERVHLVFENATEFNETGNVSCVCNISSTGTYTIRAQDLRFQNAAGGCTRSNVLTGFSPNCSAEKPIDLNLREKQIKLTGDKMFVLSVDPQNKPQMVWIEAKGESTTTTETTTLLTVQCFSVNQVPTTPTSPTPVTANLTTSTDNESTTSYPMSSTAPVSSPTEPTFTSSQKTSTSPLTISSSSQTAATSSQTTSRTTSFITTYTTIITTGHEPTEMSSSNGSSVQHVRADDSGGLPIVAVVVPVIVILLLAAAVVMFCWRKRLSRNADSKASLDENISDQQITGSEIKQDFDKGPLKTPDNYIVFEPENTYTYIDHGDIKDKTSPNNETKIKNQNSGQTKQQQTSNPGYFVLEPETIPSARKIGKKNESQNEIIPVDSKEAANESHDYFVLEPHSSASAKNGATQKIAENSDKAHVTENHNYFVLEPQTAHDTESETQKTNEIANLDIAGAQGTQNHNYFVLEPRNMQTANTIAQKTPTIKASSYFVSEPHDTYSSIDPDDVVVQTLPENEYNVINMKGNPVSRDPNYATLKTAGRIGKDIEESGEYSHIRNNPDKKVDMNE